MKRKYYLFSPVILLFIFIIGYFTMAGIGLFISTDKEFPGVKKHTIYMATGEIHSDFVFPFNSDVYNWEELLPLKDYPKIYLLPKLVQIGWGDKGFYLEMGNIRNLTSKLALNAAFLPSTSVMHVIYYQSLPETYYHYKKVEITTEQYQILIKHILSGFQLTGNQRPILLPSKGYYDNDNFYQGKGSYHLFNTCNMWTNRGMKKAGIKTSIWTPFKYGVAKFLD